MIFSHDDLLVYFSNKQTYRVFDREVCQYYCQYTYLKSIQIEIEKEKKANN